jgi:hypothetical protein
MLAMLLAAATAHFILVHGPDEQEIQLNVNEVSSVREPRSVETHWKDEVHCVVFMTNGKFVGITEECQQVIQKIKEAE